MKSQISILTMSTELVKALRGGSHGSDGAWLRCNASEYIEYSSLLRLALHPHNRTLHPVQLPFLGLLLLHIHEVRKSKTERAQEDGELAEKRELLRGAKLVPLAASIRRCRFIGYHGVILSIVKRDGAVQQSKR